MFAQLSTAEWCSVNLRMWTLTAFRMNRRQSRCVTEDDFMVSCWVKSSSRSGGSKGAEPEETDHPGNRRIMHSGSEAKYPREMKRTEVWWSESRKARASGQPMLWDKGGPVGRIRCQPNRPTDAQPLQPGVKQPAMASSAFLLPVRATSGERWAADSDS